MRILHTSDWHLGQKLLGESREEEHKAFLDWLLDELEKREVDALIVAGDIFDFATPPSYARKIYNDFLAKFVKSKCNNLIIIGGNHDSSIVLNEEQSLLKELNIFVVGGYEEEIKKIIIPIEDKERNLKGIVAAIPYLKESDLRNGSYLIDSNLRAKELESAIASYYQKAFEEAKKIALNLPIIATGHLSTLKIDKNDAVREIYIGSLEVFDKDLFPPFDYIALGHYHKFSKMKNICYSGSPFPLAFDEIKDQKVILDVKIEDSLIVEKIEIPTFRKLHHFKGEFEELKSEISKINPISPILPELVSIEIIPKGIVSIKEILEELKSINSNLKIIKSVVEKKEINFLNDGDLKKEMIKEINPIFVFQEILKEEENLDQKEKDELILKLKEILEDLNEDLKA